MRKEIGIIGGGFGGIRAALSLAQKKLPDAHITLISDKSHFEYTPAFYRVVTGRSPLEVCIPITEIIVNKRISFINDRIESAHLQPHTLIGSSGKEYRFDHLVLALGAETSYFGIPGLPNFSYGFKSIQEAQKLKLHIHHLFDSCVVETNPDEKVCLLNFVVVGGGPSGTELAGELSFFLKKLSREYKVDQSLIAIGLMESTERIVPALPESVSLRITDRLRHLGVNIFVNRPMTHEKMEEISVRGLTMKTETVIWTAGVKPNSLYSHIPGLETDKKGRVIVDEFLRVKGFEDVYIIGDGASTLYSGMAQTAISDGASVAENIARQLSGELPRRRRSRKPYYAIPIGPGWAASSLGSVTFYGRLGLFIRRVADFRYFLTILPLKKALTVFRRGKSLCDSCGICGTQ